MAEAVKEAPVPFRQYPRLEALLRAYPMAGEVGEEAFRLGGGVAQAKAGEAFRGEAPPLQVRPGLRMGGKPLLEVGLGQLEDLQKLFAGPGASPPCEFHPGLLRQALQGGLEVQALYPLHEGDEVAPGLAAEAVEEALLLVHVEGGGPLLVKGAKPLPTPAARRFEGHVAGNHLLQGEAAFDGLYGLPVHAPLRLRQSWRTHLPSIPYPRRSRGSSPAKAAFQEAVRGTEGAKPRRWSTRSPSSRRSWARRSRATSRWTRKPVRWVW